MFKKIQIAIMAAVMTVGLLGPVVAPITVQADAVNEIQKGVRQSGGRDNRTSLTKFIENVTNILLFLIGIIAVIVIVISGLRFVTSNGNSDQVASARNGVIYAVVGIVVAVMAYAIVRFVTSNIN